MKNQAVAQSAEQEEEEENASNTYDSESADLKNDPFFSEFYQSYYDPVHKIAEVDAEPQFTYHIDHIHPYEVDIPEHSAEATNQKSVVRDPRKSDNYDGDKQFFEFYNKYFKDKIGNEPTTDETVHTEVDEYDEHQEEGGDDKEEEEDHGLKKKKWKKKKKLGNKKKFFKKKKEEDKKPEDKHTKPVSPAIFEEEPAPASDEIQYRYTIDFSPSQEYERIKAISDKQRDELKSNPDSCKIYTSDDGQKCYECYDPKSGDTSESCSYEDDPTPQRYAYETQKSYDSKKDPSNYDEGEDEAEPETESPPPSKKKTNNAANKSKEKQISHDNKKSEPIKVKPQEEEEEEEEAEEQGPEDEAEEDYSNFDDYDTESTDNSSADDNENEAEVLQPYKHSFFFSAPQKTHEENKATESSFSYSPIYDTHSDVDEALKEFSTRDWSKCEKHSKGDLTCYRCKDEKGVKHEECMFVQESRPKSVRVAYKPKSSKTTSSTPATLATTTSPFKISLTTVTPAITTLRRGSYRPTQATPFTFQTKTTPNIHEEPIISKKKSKKIVIVKRRKPDDDIDPVNKKSRSGDDGVVEKRTIKRTIAVSVTGNGARPANYTSSVIDTSMKKGKF